jgi:hypothetical protein
VADKPSSQSPPTETDSRFPSGPWKGFWLQRGLEGRQWMHLTLEFVNGRVVGEGRDGVGEFVIRGSYELGEGRCTLTKSYPGSHDVDYRGANEGDGKWLWGLWRIRSETGGFHLWPKGEPDPTGSELKAAEPLPPSKKVRLEPVSA